jgi:O-antigen/teichoic acid export membrane protein
MTGLRRGLLWISAGRYLVTAINLATLAIMARLLTPTEYGLSVLGTAGLGIAEAIRELGGSTYLIQDKELTQEKIRTTVTVSFLVTVVMAATVISLSGTAARYYGAPGLDRFLQVIALWYFLGPFTYPIYALMSREMAFGTLAFITVVTTLLNGAASIVLALLGFSYLSLAWANVISAAAGMFLCFHFRPDLSIFRPLLRDWRGVLVFGAYNSVAAVLLRISEAVPFLLLGRILNADAVGLVQRTLTVCQFPERVILSSVAVVALPAFSEHARQGRDLKHSYFRAIEHITVVQWPSLILLVLLAHPIISALLGQQWLDTVPLVQVIAGALIFYFPIGLTYPTVVAAGGVRHMPWLVLAQGVVSISVLAIAARHGLLAAAWSMFLTIPFNVLLSVVLVRLHVPFRWGDLAASLRKSFTVSLLCAAGPLAIVIGSGWRADPSIGAAIVMVILSAVGWIAGLWLTRHPLLNELLSALGIVKRSPVTAKALGLGRRVFGRTRLDNNKP